MLPSCFPRATSAISSSEQEGRCRNRAKSAAHVVEGLYSTQVQTHTSLETHGGICEWDGDKLTAWISTQAVHGSRDGIAGALKIPQGNVRVITEYMGGGFGASLDLIPRWLSARAWRSWRTRP